MRDLTNGSIARHLLGMAAFIGVGLIVQTLYFLVDLYFVSHIGPAAIAGVVSAGVSMFIVMAASQVIAVGALALISQAVGRKDDADAQGVFEQSLSMSLLATAVTLAIGYLVGPAAVKALGADAASGRQGQLYLIGFLPALAMMFPMGALGSALRASGVVGPPMMLQSATVLINVVLAPVLIAGWGSGHPLGVLGAGVASSIATAIGVVAMVALFNRMQSHLRLHLPGLRPVSATWRRIAGIGLPAAGEFALMFIITTVVIALIKGFGAQAQAGFGIGQRIMQAIFLPAMAVAFAAAPIAGQNFGARLPQRVRATFRAATLIGSGVMLLLTLVCQLWPQVLIHPFTQDPKVVAITSEYLHISSWNFVAIGVVFACSGMFQAFGDTKPALLSSASRLLTFAVPAIVISRLPGVQLHDFWRLSVLSVYLQAGTSLMLLRYHMRRKLDFAAPPPMVAEAT